MTEIILLCQGSICKTIAFIFIFGEKACGASQRGCSVFQKSRIPFRVNGHSFFSIFYFYFKKLKKI